MSKMIVAVCISDKKGEQKKLVDSVTLKIDHGIIGDAHAGNWDRPVSLLAHESIVKMRQKGLDFPVGFSNDPFMLGTRFSK